VQTETFAAYGRRSQGGEGGQGGQVPPTEFGAGDANANCPPRFCHISTKISDMWPSKYAKIRFRCPGPRWGSPRRSPRRLSRLERGHPSPYSTPLGTDPPSALAMRPPQKSSQIYAYVAAYLLCYTLCNSTIMSCWQKLPLFNVTILDVHFNWPRAFAISKVFRCPDPTLGRGRRGGRWVGREM